MLTSVIFFFKKISLLGENKGNVQASALSESSQDYTVSDEICKCQMQLLFIYENKNGKLLVNDI